MGRGKLVFKEKEKAKKAPSKKHSIKSTHEVHSTGEVATSISCSTINDLTSTTTNIHEETNAITDMAQLPSPTISVGCGLISSSGTVITGQGTTFKHDLRVGDAIIAQTQKGDEMRIITMVLSHVSISISSAFSCDLKTPSPYKFINKPRDIKKERAVLTQKELAEKEAVERQAMGTYGNKDEIVYRQKTEHGSYRIIKEKATTDMTRSDLLSIREKKKSDRYC